ncbi:hypothetical protein [Dactylosporangium darangshiense]|uniref:Uncharacterized protein n=1 Tax=Dactylosporangium darangshiense TaxID=579108 RepID=A0ABP8DVB2_9ACTN
MDPAEVDLNAEEKEIMGAVSVSRAPVVWAMTSPVSGRFSPVETRSDVVDLSERFNELRSHGQGYLELRLLDRNYPVLTLAFRDDYAVVHLFTSADQVPLLAGDGTVPLADVVEVPIIDDLKGFTGDFVLGVDRAWDRVRSFIRTESPSDLGEWREL